VNKAKLNDVGLLVLRLVLAAIILWYGAQKVGIFGGGGVRQTLESFKSKNGFPEWLTALAIISEFLGGIAVGIGLLTRLAAFGIACTMAVASWSNYSGGGGYKAAHLPLALFGMAAALVLTGAGSFSLEGILFARRKKRK
jgi:putative oxidoreductase